MASLLELKNIEAGYGDIKILTDLTLEVAPSENVLLLGPNGAGKTTVFRVAAGLIKPNKGTVSFDGKEITRWPTSRRVNSGMGYLLQTGNIVPSLTGKDNLRLSMAALDHSEFESRIEELVAVVPALKTIIPKRAGLLSGGERQLLAIAMILARRPKLLLLDEPTAGLAPGAAREIIEYLAMLQERMGVSAVCMVEHNLKEALGWASRVVIMAGGKIVYESGDVGACRSNPEMLEKHLFETGTAPNL